MAPARKKKPSRKRKTRRTRRFLRWKPLLAILAVFAVSATGVGIYLDVAVRNRFDGRLWMLPSRIYSDSLALVPGLPVSGDQLAERLDRCGYARVEATPERPGQYRLGSREVSVYLRGYHSPVRRTEDALVRLRFSAGRLVSLRDRDGEALRRAFVEPELLATLYGSRQEERRPLRLEDVPPQLIQAVLAAEDTRFYDHHGLDFRGILRAALANLSQGRIVQGGSTITQQTVKNLYLTQKRTWWRKIRELAMAPVLDGRYTKDRILQVYLNEVYLGQRGAVSVCGAQAASRYYFGRDLEHLSLGEYALLAGMIRSPGRYNPFRHPERAVERRNQVLAAMTRQGEVSESKLEAASQETLVLASGGGGFTGAPYAVDFVRSRLSERFSGATLTADGLQIYTTLDTSLQLDGEAALRTGLERLDRQVPQVKKQIAERTLQGALLVTEPASGAIRAMVGGRDYRDSQFNRVVQARRQPGSCFKPFVYAAGFELTAERDPAGLTPVTLLEDEPLEMSSGGKLWRPANYDREFRGWVTVREALELSLNVPTVRAAQQVGLDNVVRTARQCGFRSKLEPLPSLALGAAEVTPIELAEGYGTLALHGERIEPWIIRAVTDRDGTVIEGKRIERRRAIRAETAYLVNHLLHGVFERGTARTARSLGYRGYAAGKTGTTDDTRDAWFVGFDREILALVWVGYDDNARTGLTGASGALPIWVDFMNRRGTGYARRDIVAPPGIVRVMIDPDSGALAGPECPDAAREAFMEGSEPQEECPLHRRRFRRWLDRLMERERRGAGPI